ncbi:hypothetical protein [Paenibacillus sabinae]|nr:hypothetical protein [Paenibacillus sabinae]
MKRIIYGEKSSIIQAESYLGEQAEIFTTHYGFEAGLQQAVEKYPDYTLVKVELRY